MFTLYRDAGTASVSLDASTGRLRWPARTGEVAVMIRWKARGMRLGVAVASLVALAVASGAGARWS